MQIEIKAYKKADLPAITALWNKIVEQGQSFPQIEPLALPQAAAFFSGQSFTGVACKDGKVAGLYILHPNNVGRCGHLANASYAVSEEARGMHIGEKLVMHSIVKARALGFRVLQFNAVVKSNQSALRLYEKLGFVQLGVVPGGFLTKNGVYEDIVLLYYTL